MSTAGSERALARAQTWGRLTTRSTALGTLQAPCCRLVDPWFPAELQTEEHAKAVCAPDNHYTPLTEEEVQVRDASGTSNETLVLCSLANDAAIEAAPCRAEHFNPSQQSVDALTGQADAEPAKRPHLCQPVACDQWQSCIMPLHMTALNDRPNIQCHMQQCLRLEHPAPACCRTSRTRSMGSTESG